MSHPQLTPGAIAALNSSDPESRNLKPIIQILEIKKIQVQNAQPAQVERYRLVISDGNHYQQAMLATQLNSQVSLDGAPGRIVGTCIVRLNEHLLNTIHNRKIIIILNIDVLTGPLGAPIGNPSNIEPTGQSQPLLLQQQHQQQPQPPPYQQQQQQQQQPYQQRQQQQPYQQQQQQQPYQQQQQQQPYFPTAAPQPVARQPARSNAGSEETDPTGTTVYPIKFLSPFQNRWAIKARVTNKSALRPWTSAKTKNSGSLFSVDLLDMAGDEIRATMFNEAATKLYEVFQVGQVYFISRGSVKQVQKRFSSIKNDYELTLDLNTVVSPCFDADNAIPHINYNFIFLDKILDCNKDDMVDVIGIVRNVSEVSSITVRHSGQEVSRRNLNIVDMSGRDIDLTIWGEKAEKWSVENPHPVIAVRGAKVSDFNQRTLSTVSSSSIDTNPDHPLAHQLRTWFDSQNGEVRSIPLSTNTRGMGGGGMGIGSGKDQRRYLNEIKDQNLGRGAPAVFVSKAYITRMKKDGALYYDACPTPGCNKKVHLSNGGWFCEKCNTSYADCEKRYTLSVVVTDSTGDSWVTCFNDVGKQILGCDAGLLAEYKEKNEAQIEVIFQAAMFQSYLFKIRAKEETYQDEPRVKCAVLSAENIDFVKEGRYLLEEIRKYAN